MVEYAIDPSVPSISITHVFFSPCAIRFASAQGSSHHLLLYATKNHYLGVSTRPEAVIGAVDAAIRSALTEPR